MVLLLLVQLLLEVVLISVVGDSDGLGVLVLLLVAVV